MEIFIQANIPEVSKSEMLKKLASQHEIEIERNKEWCEQRIIWHNGQIVRYEKLESYQ